MKIQNLYFRKDRISKPKTSLKCIQIKKHMGWCDDIRSKDYNKLIRFPFPWRAEKLYRSDNTYNIVTSKQISLYIPCLLYLDLNIVFS